MTRDRLEEMLEQQWAIQSSSFGHQFDRMTQSQRIAFIKDMVLAATHELHEALDETGWKSWSTAQHVFLDLYLSELTDCYLLLMNLFLVTGMYPDEVAKELVERVSMKQKLNVQRQESGY